MTIAISTESGIPRPPPAQAGALFSAASRRSGRARSSRDARRWRPAPRRGA